MEWVSFMTGVMGTAFAFALFSSNNEDETDPEFENEEENETNDFIGRSTQMYCQSCRKVKNHKEIEKDLWQCTRCKRHVDLR